MKSESLILAGSVTAALLLAAAPASAQTVWTGGGGANMNWSAGANWSSGVAPTTFEILLFGAGGTVAAATTVNNIADTTIDLGGLSYTNGVSGAWHVTEIPAGNVLTVNGPVTVGGGTLNGLVTSAAATGGGTLFINGGALNIGNSGASSLNQNTILNLAGVSNFVCYAMSANLGVGAVNRAVATLNLAARSNYIAVTTLNLNTGSTSSSGSSTALRLGDGTNVVNATTINIAAGRTSATAQFNGATGGLRLRGNGGTDTDRANLTLGHRNTGSSTGGTTTGSLLLNDHPIDAMAGTLVLGRNSRTGTEAGLNGVGRLEFNQGILDVTTINMGVMSGNSPTATAAGTLTVGAGGRMYVENISLVNVTSTGAGTTGSGRLNIYGGQVFCTNDIVKTTTLGTGTIAMNGGSLSATGAVGTTSIPLDALNLTNATLRVSAGLSAAVNVTSLACEGANTIHVVGDIPPVTGYPTSIPLIKYATPLAGSFTGVIGSLPPSTPAYAGYLSNNTVNLSIDLVLTAGPTPARAISWNGSPTTDWDTVTANWLFSGASATYNQGDFVRFEDTATGSGVVNLTGIMTPSSMTVSNQGKTYTLGGPGALSGSTPIIKDGLGTLNIVNTGPNDNSGGLQIKAGTVRVGDGNYSGNLGTGSIVNDGALIFNRADDVTVGPIAGTGTLTKQGVGSLILNTANSFTGAVTVVAGTLTTGDNAALGTIDGGTTINNGATLNVNERNLGAEPITVSGAGVANNGAIVNNGAVQQLNALRYVTLAGNTVFGGAARWDIRGAPSINDPANAGLSTGGNAYNLTKIGGAQMSLVGATVDPALGDVDVQGGIFGVETATTGLGDPNRNLTIRPGATLQLYNLTNHLNKRISLESDGAVSSLIVGAGSATVAGPITLVNACFLNVNGTSLTLAGPLAGAQLTKNGTGTLILNGNATHAATIVAASKVLINGTHSGGVTNAGFSVLGGTGTLGFVSVGGSLLPGDANVAGTLTTTGLVLDPGAELVLDLGPTNTVGGVNDLIQVNGDLIVNGNNVTINPSGLLLKGTGNRYRIINYTGNLLWNGDLIVSGPNNYTFTVDRSIAGQINLVVSGGPPIWNGGSALTSNWSDAANWSGSTIQSGETLYFAGSTRLANQNDTVADTLYNDLVFAAGAGAFTLSGNSIMLGNRIANESTSVQTVNLPLKLGVTNTFDGAAGNLVIGGEVNRTTDLSALILAGTGTLSNRFTGATITNTLMLRSTNANWTLANNPAGSPVSLPVALDIQSGTLNFGVGDSAPELAATTTINHRLGVLAGQPATLNMVKGTLSVSSRFNTGAGANTIAAINQTGGTINCLDIFQGSDSDATAVTTINVSGGLFNVGEAEDSPNTLYLCSRGTGILNVSDTALVRCGVLDVSRNASSAGTKGTVNLDGGTLDVQRVFTASGSAGTGGSPTASFNFNGGILKARQTRTDFFQGRTSAPAIPIKATVRVGGAIFDSAGFDIGVLEPLQHDTDLGANPDGGLTKNGAGILTLAQVNTYTGPTVVNAGTLRVTGTLTDSAVTVAAGGTLDGTGAIGGSLTVNGTVAPGIGTIGTLTVTNGVTLSGTTVMEINRTANTNDVLRTISGSIQYGGTLQVVNLAGTLQNGNSFKLFNAGNGTYSGTFTSVDLPPIDGGGYWNVSRLNVDGTISVTLAPNITSVVASGGNLVISGANGAPNAGYEVVSTTDLTTPLASWTSAGSGTFGPAGEFSISVPIDPGTPHRFFMIRML